MARSHTLGTLVAATTFLAAAGLTGSARAQFVFDGAVSIGVGQRPDDVAAGDWDGDGDFDLAVTTDGNGNQDRIELLINNGNGTFSPGGSIVLPNSSSPGDLEAADLDRDGDTDLAVVLRDFNQVMAVINNGGSFSQGLAASIGINGRGLSQADMDGDGDTDLVIANRDSNTATVLRNNGNATFTSITLNVGNDPRWATFVDIDGNANIDVAVANHDDRNISLFLNNGGGFVSAGTLSTGNNLRPEGITSADLNNNGRGDLAAGTGDPERASVWLNQGGSFGGRADYPTGGQDTSEILAADFDCDGAVDLATISANSHNVSVLRNLGAGTFGGPVLLSVGTEPDGFTAADLDGDADLDLAVANQSSNTVSVIINQTCDAGSAATLDEITMVVGTLISGSVNDLVGSDDVVVRTRSGFGETIAELHKMEMIVGATTTVDSPATLSLTIETRIDENSGSQRVSLRNWTSGQFEQVGQRTIGLTDQVHVIEGLDATRYVSGAGEIDMELKHLVFVPFLAFQFDSFIDQVEMFVQ